MSSTGIFTINTWRDLNELSVSLKGYIFRGQAQSSWNLETRLDRFATYCKISRPSLVLLERELINQFRNRRLTYPSEALPAQSNLIDWLAMMQHHGAPTRLLDFSHSLFVASYFAVTPEDFSDSAIWAIHYNRLLNFMFPGKSLGNDNLDAYVANKNNENLYALINNRILLHSMMPMIFDGAPYWEGRLTGVVPVEPRYFNRRQLRQRGLFLLPINFMEDFTKNLLDAFSVNPEEGDVAHEYLKLTSISEDEILPSIIKIQIPKEKKKEIIRSLLRMGINAESLFPGLDGMARALVEPIYTVDDF